MKKEDYINKISGKLNISKKLCDNVIDEFLEELRHNLVVKDKVNITNLGLFKKTRIESKVIFSPIDGSTLDTKDYYRFSFTSSKKLLDELKNKE